MHSRHLALDGIDEHWNYCLYSWLRAKNLDQWFFTTDLLCRLYRSTAVCWQARDPMQLRFWTPKVRPQCMCAIAWCLCQISISLEIEEFLEFDIGTLDLWSNDLHFLLVLMFTEVAIKVVCISCLKESNMSSKRVSLIWGVQVQHAWGREALECSTVNIKVSWG